MTDEPANPNDYPASPVSSVTDPIGLVLTAIGAGAVAGAFAITVGVIALRIVQGGATQTEANQADFTLLSAAVMIGPIVAVTVTMLGTRPINDLWRRGVASAIAVFCAFILSGLAAPLDLAAGRTGLIVFALLLLAGSAILTRRAKQIASQ